MTSALHPILAAVLYVCAAGLLWRGLSAGKPLRGGARTGVFVLAAGALALHASLLYIDLFLGGLNLGLTSAASLVAWAVTLLFLAAALFQPIESLGTLILPVAAATLLLEWLWPTRHLVLPGASPVQAAHIVISLLAYSLLSIAVVQSLVLSLQERALHRRQAGGFLRNLPPLETMEHLLFRMIAVGFVLLTLTLVVACSSPRNCSASHCALPITLCCRSLPGRSSACCSSAAACTAGADAPRYAGRSPASRCWCSAISAANSCWRCCSAVPP